MNARNPNADLESEKNNVSVVVHEESTLPYDDPILETYSGDESLSALGVLNSEAVIHDSIHELSEGASQRCTSHQQFFQFFNSNPNKKLLESTGKIIIKYLYTPNLENDVDLGELRYIILRNRVQQKIVDPESLPPSDDAAKFHIYRVYFQIQLWMGNQSIDPLDWCWKHSENLLIPIQTEQEAGPPELMRIISCSCKTGCKGQRCSCVKNNLKCSIFCKICEGKNCNNINEPEIDMNDEDTETPIQQEINSEHSAVVASEYNDKNEICYEHIRSTAIYAEKNVTTF